MWRPRNAAVGERLWSEYASSVGLEIVYQTRISVSQPDYTAECLAARNAGAGIVMGMFDQNTLRRLAASCTRQGFRPVYTPISTGTADDFKDDPNMGHLYVSSNVFPYTQSGTPATDEFQAARKAYGGTVPFGVPMAVGWVAVKLLERVGAHLPEPPTTGALLQELWSVRDDTLGGLTQPLTFVENRPATPSSCWFDLVAGKGAWVSPDGFRLKCEPTPQALSQDNR